MIPAEVLKRVRRIQIRTAALVNDVFAGQYHSAFKGHGIEFEEVREYTPGDDVRLLDWNVTARAGRPFIKTYREERELTVMLLVDVSASLGFGTRAQLKRELVAELGATLAFSAIRNNDKVGLILFSDHVERFVPPRKGTRHVLRVVRELLYHETAGRHTDIGVALRHCERVLHRRSVIFLISDFQSPDFARPLGVVSRRNDVIPVRVTDAAEQALPPIGYVEVFDPETGRQCLVDTRSRRLRRRMQAHAIEKRARLIGQFRRRGLDLIDVRTGESFVEPLRRFFREREVRR